MASVDSGEIQIDGESEQEGNNTCNPKSSDTYSNAGHYSNEGG